MLNLALVLCIVQVPQLSWFSLKLSSPGLGTCCWKCTYQMRCLFGMRKKLSRRTNGYFAICVLKDRAKGCSRHLPSRMLSSVIFPIIGNYMNLLWACFKPTERLGSAFGIGFFNAGVHKKPGLEFSWMWYTYHWKVMCIFSSPALWSCLVMMKAKDVF